MVEDSYSTDILEEFKGAGSSMESNVSDCIPDNEMPEYDDLTEANKGSVKEALLQELENNKDIIMEGIKQNIRKQVDDREEYSNRDYNKAAEKVYETVKERIRSQDEETLKLFLDMPASSSRIAKDIRSGDFESIRRTTNCAVDLNSTSVTIAIGAATVITLSGNTLSMAMFAIIFFLASQTGK